MIDVSLLIKERIKLNTKKFNDIGEKRRSMFGCMKGKSWVSEDFDAPLDELKEYME
ncbi:MAG: DUF2281 domain-containing protein [Oscillospiraceae bacterium]|nr:DUF2281 domain-containing protein [Oscillospiraceae bacterium]